MLRFDPQAPGAGPAPADDERAALRGALEAAHEALRESRRQFAQTLSNLSGIAYQCTLTAPWQVSFVSRGVEALTGYRAEELEQKTAWAELMHPDDLSEVEAEVAAAVAARRSFACCYRIYHRSGELRWVREQGQAVCDGAGVPQFLEGVITDATVEKQLELSLRQAEAEARQHAEAERVDAERMRSILDAVPQMLWSYNVGTGTPFYSEQWVKFTGARVVDPADRLGLIHPDDRDRAVAEWRACLATGRAYETHYRLRHHSGEFRWILSRGNLHRDGGGDDIWYGSCTDIHQRVLAQQALEASESLTRGLIEASPDSISVLDLEGFILSVNAATLRVLGLDDASQLLGQRWGGGFPECVRIRAEAALASVQGGESARVLVQAGEDQRWWDIVLAPVREESGMTIRIVAIARDVTDQKLAEESAQWAANHDALTGLPNRFYLQKRLDAAVEEARANGTRFGLLLLDVDDFKRVNDMVGHDAGDALLCIFAQRLRAALREEDSIARLGGDEFAVLLAGAGHEDEVAAAVDSILEALREPCLHGGRLLDCQASIGASIFPLQGRDRAELLKNADVALYAAKAAGRANLKMFRPEMRMGMQKHESMLNLARTALRDDRIRPFYQPKIGLRGGAVAGFEALLRWEHPTKGAQSPATISAAFEDLNLASEISDRMMESVIEDLARWRGEGLDFGHVAINAAAAEFRRGDFADKLLERLHEAAIPPHLIQVEVAESVFVGRGADFVERALKALSAAGVGIALDDFGTGYASLSHLKQFPIDTIKVDRSFIRDLDRDPGDAAIVDAVINLGRSLGIRIVAEGVESERQHDLLLSLGCDFGQGFLYGKAAPAAELERVLGAPRPLRRLRLAG